MYCFPGFGQQPDDASGVRRENWANDVFVVGNLASGNLLDGESLGAGFLDLNVLNLAILDRHRVGVFRDSLGRRPRDRLGARVWLSSRSDDESDRYCADDGQNDAAGQ